jgi:hypothetical protein
MPGRDTTITTTINFFNDGAVIGTQIDTVNGDLIINGDSGPDLPAQDD